MYKNARSLHTPQVGAGPRMPALGCRVFYVPSYRASCPLCNNVTHALSYTLHRYAYVLRQFNHITNRRTMYERILTWPALQPAWRWTPTSSRTSSATAPSSPPRSRPTQVAACSAWCVYTGTRLHTHTHTHTTVCYNTQITVITSTSIHCSG